MEQTKKFAPKYVQKNNYTIVFTPHYLQQQYNRYGQEIDYQEVPFDQIFQKIPKYECYAYEFENFYIYMRKIHNKIRGRNEMEVISLTPNRHLQTINKKFAKLIII